MTLEELALKGFDIAAAMELCIDDEDIYREVLETALEEGKEKVPLIRECEQNENYDRYIIEVYGLKNAARQIGAMKLSEMAKEQENAGKAREYDKIHAGVEPLLVEYNNVIAILEEFMAS
ncbi:MAG: hypothetical protein PHP50_12830 [Lachnospiraceae bacterium]|nr:hypothetical protein [Lachnospiraceae bacterium]